MMLKEISKGWYKAYRQTKSGVPHRGKGCDNKTFRDWWIIHARGDTKKGIVHITSLATPENLVGKKIEIFVRIKNDRTKKDNIRYAKTKQQHHRIRTQ